MQQDIKNFSRTSPLKPDMPCKLLCSLTGVKRTVFMAITNFYYFWTVKGRSSLKKMNLPGTGGIVFNPCQYPAYLLS